jgi:hypothetical protein
MSLGTSDSGTTVYADSATMRREGDLVKMLVLFDFKTKQTKADVSYLSAKAQMEYDCAEQRFEGHAVLYYSDNMGNGQLLDRSSGKGRRLRVSPGSLDHDLWKLACDKKWCEAAINHRQRHGYAMSGPRPKRDSMSLKEATISNMWEISVIVEVLERFGRITEMG